MNTIKDMHPADIAERFSEMEPRERHMNFMLLPTLLKVEVFPYFSVTEQQDLIKSLGDKDFAEVMNNLDPDDRTEIFETFPDDLLKRSINVLNDAEKETALNLLGYPKDCIARLMTPNYIQARKDWTVEETLQHIKKYGKKAETLTHIYVVDEQTKLIDDLQIGQLLMADSQTKLSTLMDYHFVSITTLTSEEDAVVDFEKYDRNALPIVTESGTLVGIVTVDDILGKMQEIDTEDIQKFGGMSELDLSYTQTSLFELVKKRASWLIILFLSEMLTASAMGHFNDEIAKAVVLTLFIPLVMSSGGNSGSQAASLIIRSLALKEIGLRDWWYVMRKEIFSGLMLGSILAVIAFIRISLWQETGIYNYGAYWIHIAFTVSVALIFIVLWGTLSGALIPFVLQRIGLDPATASAPFVATLVDVTGLIIYFNVAALFLKGILL